MAISDLAGARVYPAADATEPTGFGAQNHVFPAQYRPHFAGSSTRAGLKGYDRARGWYDAEEAPHIGLMNRIYDDEELESSTQWFAEKPVAYNTLFE